MPIIVSEIKITPDEPKELAFEKAFSVLKVKSSEVKNASISKISVDARHKDRVHLVCSVAVECENEEKIAAKAKAKNVVLRKIAPAEIPVLKNKKFCSIKELSALLEGYKIYEGSAEKFIENACWEGDTFPQEKGKWFYWKKTALNNGKLVYRFAKREK